MSSKNPAQRFRDIVENIDAIASFVSGMDRDDFAADRKRSVSEADRRFYAAAYAQPGAIKAGMEVFRAFERDAKDFAGFAKTKLHMPMLVITGEKASGEFLISQGKLVDDHVDGVVIKGSGHWLVDEYPDLVLPRLVAFFGP